MKAIVKTDHGAGNIELRDVPVPPIGDGDVLVEVKAAGLCGSDLAFVQGQHADILRPPVILGHEFAGVVARVGKNATQWKVGDRVVSDNTGKVCGECYACSTANYLACPEQLGLGYGMDGGFAKYCRIPGETLKIFPHALMRIPDCMSFEEAAILDPACNAYMAVVQEARLMPGEYAAVFGVGALGQFSIEAARAAGAAKIIAIGLSRDAERFETAKLHGATDLVISDREDAVEAVKRITNGEGVAVAIDCAGVSEVLKQAIQIVRTGGAIVKIGYDVRPLGFSLDDVINRAIALKGHFGYDWISWRNVMNLVVAGKFTLNTAITHRMPLAQFDQALALLKEQKALKIILYPED